MLVSWGARALYVGPGFGLSPHRNAVAVLAMGLDRPLEVANDARDPGTGFYRCRTALIEPHQQHFLRITGADCVFLYLDALSHDLASLRRRCRRSSDRRIVSAVDALLSAPGLAADTATLAARAGLSVSRFQHLFKATTGVTVRRFRIWARMRRAVAMAVAGATITHAALEAGFSSPAHFAAAFREMFGMAPTRFVAGSPIFVDGDWRG